MPPFKGKHYDTSKRGHFYFGQRGHYHFGMTEDGKLQPPGLTDPGLLISRRREKGTKGVGKEDSEYIN
jgi:hypothetical protein